MATLELYRVYEICVEVYILLSFNFLLRRTHFILALKNKTSTTVPLGLSPLEFFPPVFQMIFRFTGVI